MNLGILLTPTATPRTSSLRSVRQVVRRVANRVSAVAAEFRTPTVVTIAQPAVVDVEPAEPDASEFFTPETMPAAEDIAEAARLYFRAADEARTADRAKRKAKKILDRLHAGRYGDWEVYRESSGRQTVDLDEVRKIFKAHGLGQVPMRQSADSLKVRRVQADLGTDVVESELRTLAGAR